MSSTRNTLIRTLHDVGAAAWFGGSLMGAVGLNGATKDISDPTERAAVAASGWARWSPIAAAAIGAHAIGGVGLIIANRDRVSQQSGVGANTAVKTALTVAAVATTAASGLVGARLAKDAKDRALPAEGGTVPSASTPPNTARLQQALRVLQWTTPVLTGAIVTLGAQQGEQQKAGQVFAGKARQTPGQRGERPALTFMSGAPASARARRSGSSVGDTVIVAEVGTEQGPTWGAVTGMFGSEGAVARGRVRTNVKPQARALRPGPRRVASGMARTEPGVSRRTVVTGSAWAVPAVVVATAAPAVAASPSSCVAVTFSANSCTQLSDDQQTTKGYRLQLCFTNVCNVPANVHVTGIQFSPGSPAQNPDLMVRVPRESTTAVCAGLLTYCTGVTTDAITVSFTTNPGAPLQVRSVPAPPACAPGTGFCPA